VAKTACYIDGFNLYHAIDALGVPHLKWLNLRDLAVSLNKGAEVASVVYFTSEMTWNAPKLMRHREYIRALKTVGVEAVLSKFLKEDKYCQKYDRYCPFKAEKQTDVALSVRILTDCLTNGTKRVILITADSDQVPTVAAIRALAQEVEVIVACPPERGQIARELITLAHDWVEIKPGRLERCIFPRNVRNAKEVVVARCPALYNHPETWD
jgi:hypothetical protein